MGFNNTGAINVCKIIKQLCEHLEIEGIKYSNDEIIKTIFVPKGVIKQSLIKKNEERIKKLEGQLEECCDTINYLKNTIIEMKTHYDSQLNQCEKKITVNIEPSLMNKIDKTSQEQKQSMEHISELIVSYSAQNNAIIEKMKNMIDTCEKMVEQDKKDVIKDVIKIDEFDIKEPSNEFEKLCEDFKNKNNELQKFVSKSVEYIKQLNDNSVVEDMLNIDNSENPQIDCTDIEKM